MKGLELSKEFYLQHGEPMLKKEFPQLFPYIATGLIGSGSECLGYDDGFSQDHDFEPGFCIFLPDEDKVDRRTAFLLERAYEKLPREFMGYKRSLISPVGGSRHGVIRTSDFVCAKTGKRDGELSLEDWFYIPEQALLELTAGELYFDGLGEFTEIRKKLSSFPEDVRLKKLAAALLLMGQSGQYNYKRLVRRGERAAAQMALFEFTENALHAAFLINGRYMPYYKWSFRALSELHTLSQLYGSLEYLISNSNSDDEFKKKEETIESVCSEIIRELRARNLSGYQGDEAEGHAYSVNESVSDNTLRSRHILFAAE